MKFDHRILIVDHDSGSRELLTRWLAAADYRNVIGAPDAEAALSQIGQLPPDLILLDVMLPHVSGLDLCQHLKQNPTTTHIPVILITAGNLLEHRLRGLEIGADDFMHKPVEPPELLARTRSLLRVKRLHDELAEAHQSRKDFISQVSHELRTPLFAIHGLAEMLLDGEVSDPAEIQNYLQTIYEQSGHLSRLVDDLLDLTGFERDAQSLAPIPLLVHDFLDDTVALMQPRATERQITLRQGSVPVDLRMLADEGRMRQVMVNLLQNALYYNDPGGWVEVGAARAADRARITVIDSGWGIPASELPHIFTRFYRGQRAASDHIARETHGAGLGLALAHQIVRAHHGQLSAKSEGVPGRGSVFYIDLPAGK